MSRMSNVIGIDFGTSSCRAAHMKGESPVIIPNRFSDGKMPFIVEIPKTKPIWSFSSIKQKIGFEEVVSIGGEKKLIIDLASNIFSAIKEDVGRYVGKDFYGTVVTVPSCFAEKQRAAIKTAAEKGGFEAVRLVDESIAAVLASGIKEDERNILVYALGGGVFTASIFKINSGIPQPLWHEGNRKLGGNDFDASIVTHTIGKINFYLDSVAFRPGSIPVQKLQKLKFHAEQAKIWLSEEVAVEIGTSLKDFIALEDSNNVQHELKLTLTRSEFERIVSQYIETTITLTKKATKRAGLAKEDIGTILLVGGSTRIPLVEKMIREEFGDEIIKAPNELVVTGAAMYGSQIPKATMKKDKQLQQKEEASDIGAETPPSMESIRNGDMSWLKEFSPYFIDAQLLWQSGKQDNAIETLENMLKELPKFIANLYCNRGEMLLDTDNIDKAILYLEKGLIHNKTDKSIKVAFHKACNLKGAKLANKGSLLKARSIIKKGLKCNPDCTGCRCLLLNIEDALKKQRRSGKSLRRGFRQKKKK